MALALIKVKEPIHNKGGVSQWDPRETTVRHVSQTVEPPFCAGTPTGTRAGTPLSALERLLEPTFVRFWSFLEIQHSVSPFTT